MDGITIKTTGFDFLEKYREEVSAAAFKNTMKKAVAAGAAIVEPELERQAPSEHGTLRRSIGVKIRGYTKSGTAVAIIGPMSRYKEFEGKARRIEQPSRIAHLLERGHKIVTGGRLARGVGQRMKAGKLVEYDYARKQKGMPVVRGFVPGTHFTEAAWRTAGRRALLSVKDVALTQLILAAQRAAKKAERARRI